LLVAGAAGGYLWWRATPEYALDNIRTALLERDEVRFRSFVDADAVISAAVTAYRPPPGAKRDEEGMLARLKNKLAKLTNLDHALQSKQAKEELAFYWSSGVTAPAPAAKESLRTVLLRHLPDAGRTLTLKQVTSEPHQVTVQGQFLLAAYQDAPVEIQLRFRRERGKLRLIEIANFRALAHAIFAAEVQWKRARNAEAEEEFRQTLRLVSIGLRKDGGLLGLDKKLLVRVSVEGLKKFPFVSARGVLSFRSRRGEVHEFPLDILFGATGAGMRSDREIILSEETGAVIPAELWDARPGEYAPALRITGVTFADGQAISMPFPEIQ
jgi:hypothetical protein